MKRVILCLVLVSITCSAGVAKIDDILLANQFDGGKAWLLDGTTLADKIDAIFGSEITAVAYQSSGRMVIAFPDNGGTVQVREPNFALVYSQVGLGTINALVVNHHDQVLIGVNEPNVADDTNPNGYNYGTVWLLNPDLTVRNQSINYGGAVRALAVQSSDRVVVGSDYVNGSVVIMDPNLNYQISQQVNFTGDPQWQGKIVALAVQSNDNVVVASYPMGATTYSELWLRKANDLTAGLNQIYGFDLINGLAVQSNDNIVVSSNLWNGTVWVSDPGLWTGGVALACQYGFGPIKAIALQSNNNIVIGTEDDVDGSDVGLLWTRDPLLNWVGQVPNFGGAITAIAVQPQTYLPMDLNKDKYVNLKDLALLAQAWTGNFADVATFAKEWLMCTDETNLNCNQ
jgi:hypothetical protein